MFQVYSESIKNLVMNYTSNILWTSVWNGFVILFWVRIILEVDFPNLQIYIQSYKYTWSMLFELMHFFQTQKYTWGGLSKFMYLIYPNSEV